MVNQGQSEMISTSFFAPILSYAIFCQLINKINKKQKKKITLQLKITTINIYNIYVYYRNVLENNIHSMYNKYTLIFQSKQKSNKSILIIASKWCCIVFLNISYIKNSHTQRATTT